MSRPASKGPHPALSRAGGAAAVQGEAVVLDGVAAGEHGSARDADRADAEVVGLLAHAAAEVVVVSDVGRLVVRLLSGEVDRHDLPALAQSLHRPVDGRDAEARYLPARPLVELGEGQRPLGRPDAAEDRAPLLRPSYDAHDPGNIPYRPPPTLANPGSIAARRRFTARGRSRPCRTGWSGGG